MKKCRKYLALCLIFALTLINLTAIAEKTPLQAEGKAKWTVMLYLCGTDLETDDAMATYNLQEIAATTPSEEVNLLIETGGTKKWHASEDLGLEISSDALQRWRFDASGYALVEEKPLSNMASPDTLADFIGWSAANYPAEKYMLVLWDHGGGSLRGLIQDELYNKAIMSLEQLEIALKAGNVPLEALVLDTCLMANLETAQAVASHAKYLIASEEVVPGQGSAYEAWLQYLYDSPDCDGAEFGKVFCDSIQQKYLDLGQDSASKMLTFSVLDLTKIGQVAEAFNQMFRETGELLENPQSVSIFSYYTQNVQRYMATTMVDLADLAIRARGKGISDATADALLAAVEDAVVYNIKGEHREYSNGISFYYNPSATVLELDHYARNSKNAPYLAFLDAVNMGWSAPAWVYELTPRLEDISREGYVVEAQASLSDEGLPRLDITNAASAVSAVNAVFYQYDQETDTWLTLGEDANIEGDFEKGLFLADFPEEWPTFNGHICEMNIVEETKGYILYHIPFRLNVPGVKPIQFQLRTGYIYDTPISMDAARPDAQAENDAFAGHFELFGVWDSDEGNSTGLPNRSSNEISDYYGMPIQMLQHRVDITMLDVFDGMSPSDRFEIDADCALALEKLPAGDYAMAFLVTDVFGQEKLSDVFAISWDGNAAEFFLADEESSEIAG